MWHESQLMAVWPRSVKKTTSPILRSRSFHISGPESVCATFMTLGSATSMALTVPDRRLTE